MSLASVTISMPDLPGEIDDPSRQAYGAVCRGLNEYLTVVTEESDAVTTGNVNEAVTDLRTSLSDLMFDEAMELNAEDAWPGKSCSIPVEAKSRALMFWILRRRDSRLRQWNKVASNCPSYLRVLAKMDVRRFGAFTRDLGIKMIAVAVSKKSPAAVAELLAPLNIQVSRRVAHILVEVRGGEVEEAVRKQWLGGLESFRYARREEKNPALVGGSLIAGALQNCDRDVTWRLFGVLHRNVREAVRVVATTAWNANIDCDLYIKKLANRYLQ